EVVAVQNAIRPDPLARRVLGRKPRRQSARPAATAAELAVWNQIKRLGLRREAGLQDPKQLDVLSLDEEERARAEETSDVDVVDAAEAVDDLLNARKVGHER